MICPGELDDMRATLDASLPDVCAVRRSTRTADDQGGWGDGWATVATVPGRVSPAAATGNPDDTDGERISTTTRWVVTLPADVDVQNDDRLVIAGRTFEVQNVDARRSWEVSTRCAVLEVL